MDGSFFRLIFNQLYMFFVSDKVVWLLDFVHCTRCDGCCDAGEVWAESYYDSAQVLPLARFARVLTGARSEAVFLVSR